MMATIATKELLVLFLIDAEPGIKSIDKLLKIFDNANFPSKISTSLNYLLENEYIIVSKRHPNNSAIAYKSTKEGKLILIQYFDKTDIVKFINNLDNPHFLLEVTEVYIIKANKADSL
ncbi:MAG: hypothetical protein EOP46_09480 [Sphingobacteriaceae bacterium]|nr:MAG: hypothetical protein EOP46_09480 [Sphingobacteriaceae bacterium]